MLKGLLITLGVQLATHVLTEVVTTLKRVRFRRR